MTQVRVISLPARISAFLLMVVIGIQSTGIFNLLWLSTAVMVFSWVLVSADSAETALSVGVSTGIMVKQITRCHNENDLLIVTLSPRYIYYYYDSGISSKNQQQGRLQVFWKR